MMTLAEVDAFLAEILRQHVADSGFREKAEANQQSPQRLVSLALFLQGDAQLVVADHAFATSIRPSGCWIGRLLAILCC